MSTMTGSVETSDTSVLEALFIKLEIDEIHTQAAAGEISPKKAHDIALVIETMQVALGALTLQSQEVTS